MNQSSDYTILVFQFSYIRSVSITCKERILVPEKSLYFLQTIYLELLWIPVNNFSPESIEKRVWAKEEWTCRQVDLLLLDMLKVVLGGGCLPNGPCTEVHYLVPITPDLAEQLSYS